MALKRLTELGANGQVFNPCTCTSLIENWVDEYAAGPVTGTSPWIASLLASGTATTSGDGNMGAIVLSGAGTADNSGAQVQGDTEWITTQAGKDIAFGCYLKFNEATEQHIYAGVAITDTTVCDGADGVAGMTASDAIGFYKPDGGTTWYAFVKATSVVLQAALPMTLVADTYYWLEFVARMTSTSAGTLTCYKDGVWLGDYPIVAGPTTDMTPTIAQTSGTASGTITTTVRKVYAACEY